MSEIVENAETAGVGDAETRHEATKRAVVAVQSAFRAIEDMMRRSCPGTQLTKLFEAERECVAAVVSFPETVGIKPMTE